MGFVGLDASIWIRSKERTNLAQGPLKPSHVLGRARIDYVQVERDSGNALKHTCSHPDHDEIHLMTAEHLQQLDASSRSVHSTKAARWTSRKRRELLALRLCA